MLRQTHTCKSLAANSEYHPCNLVVDDVLQANHFTMFQIAVY